MLGDPALEANWEKDVTDAQAAYVRAVEAFDATLCMDRGQGAPAQGGARSGAQRPSQRHRGRSSCRGTPARGATMLELRTGEGAELEIRRMAVACLRVLQREAPALFADFEIYLADDKHDAARVAYHKV